MKVVDLVTRNSEKLSLHFSDFSTIFDGFYKFAVLGRQRNSNLQIGPSRIKTNCRTAPSQSLKNRGSPAGQNPARGRLGKSLRRSRSTRGWSWTGSGAAGRGSPTEQVRGGGGELAPASSGGRGVCGRGCGASLDHGESVSGSSSGEGGLGKSAPRRV